jgi:hypothetical protein
VFDLFDGCFDWSEFDQVKMGVEDGLSQLATWSMSYLLSKPFICKLEQCFCHMESPTLASFSIIALDFSTSLSTVITSTTLVWDGILAVLERAEQ